MLPVARQALADALAEHGNPSSLHSAGRAARSALELSRERLARTVGADPHELVFTGGGTEADNIAVKGLYWQRHGSDARRVRILAPRTEHHAVLDVIEWLVAAQGAHWDEVPVDPVGRVRLDRLAELIDVDPGSVALIAVMAASNEVGTTQPMADVVALATEHGIPVHCDAVQAMPWSQLDFAAAGVDTMALSAHKLGGPVGVGALLIRRGLDLVPLLHGGGQERQVRSGTVDVAGAASFAAAAHWHEEHRDEVVERVFGLRQQLVRAVQQCTPSAHLRGDAAFLAGAAPGEGRLVNNAHFTFPCCDGDSLLYLLDARGIEVSTGSACQAGLPQPSETLLAMGCSEQESRAALRFSLGVSSTYDDVMALAAAIGPVAQRAANAGLAKVARDATGTARTG
ncbi:MAG: cysteine desulfurase NifS [Micrococcales bacterium]|nr:MAG: cysteine desulfurase NifS [Micrococcales bacterium]PIE27550.1 MAG: cysteine desulfurase NifS [Micrococcales bacterium]